MPTTPIVGGITLKPVTVNSSRTAGVRWVQRLQFIIVNLLTSIRIVFRATITTLLPTQTVKRSAGMCPVRQPMIHFYIHTVNRS